MGASYCTEVVLTYQCLFLAHTRMILKAYNIVNTKYIYTCQNSRFTASYLLYI